MQDKEGTHYATGVLDVVEPDGTQTFAWNGNPDDRAAARAEFEARMLTGRYLAVVHDSPGKSHQIRSFDEVLDHERERGTVAVQISPAIVGG